MRKKRKLARMIIIIDNLMFLCCDVPTEKGNHALEMFKTPQSLSVISQKKEKQVRLRAFIPSKAVSNSRVITNISTNPKGNINQIVNHIEAEGQDQDYALKKVMKSNYQRLIQEYQRTNKMWTDPQFPTQQKSFGLGQDFQKVVWKRVGQIIKNPVFIGDKIEPGDILQGKIGDCYFLSAIAGLAEKEYRIKQIFPNLQINKNGIYMARVLFRGVLMEVVVDDYFPVSKKQGKLVTANPAGGNQIWVMILQKCWAKLFGSYQAIDGGLPNQVLHAFSGAPIFQYVPANCDDDELQDIFKKIVAANKADYVICCGTNADQDVQQMGLVEGHAYTIIEAFDKPRKLLQVRNPWGEKEWTGRGSDSDKQFWNTVSSADKKRLGYNEKNDGLFFIFWQDFLQYFQVINICKVNDKANYYYQELTYPKDAPVFSAMVLRGGHVTLAVTQQNKRAAQSQNQKYATVVMIVARKIGGKGREDYQYVSSFTQRNTCDANEQLQSLPAGEYVVYTMLSGQKNKQQATLSCYCENPVQLYPLTQLNADQFLHRIFLDHARKNTQNQQRIFGNVDVWVCMEIIYQSGFGYTVIHIGTSVKSKFGLTFNQEEYTQNNFELLPPYKGKGTFKMVCQSGSDSIVLCKIIPKGYAVEASMPIPNIKRLC